MRVGILRSLLFTALLLWVGKAALGRSAMEDILFAKVLFGENHKREDIVQDALTQLEMTTPDDPEVLAARIRYFVRHAQIDDARALLRRLADHAPHSAALQSAQTSIMLTTQDGRLQLQQARLLAVSGHAAEAVVVYRKLFNGVFPSDALAIEYWQAVAGTKGGADEAMEQLRSLDQRHPGNNNLKIVLARMMFSSGRADEGFLLLRQAAMSADTRSTAAELWFAQIGDMAVSEKSIIELKRFLSVFSEGEVIDSARTLLAAQTRQWQDPAFRARARGLAIVSNGGDIGAENDLIQALKKAPSDGEVLGALGIVYSRKGERFRAVETLSHAIKAAPDNSNRSKWESLLRTNRYWLLIEEGDAALKAKQFLLARGKYQEAAMVDGHDGYAPEGLGDVAVALNDPVQAESFYLQAVRLDPYNIEVIRSLSRLYRARSVADAQQFFRHLSARQRLAVSDLEKSMVDDQLSQRAASEEERGQWQQAIELQRERLKLQPGNVWTLFHLAKDTAASGHMVEADALFSQGILFNPRDFAYVKALYLSSTDRDAQALAILRALPRASWDSTISAMEARLEEGLFLQHARLLREQGHAAEALQLLQSRPQSDRIDLELADWAQMDGDWKKAEFYERRILERTPDSVEGRLGLAEVQIGQGFKSRALESLRLLEQAHGVEIASSLALTRRMARARMLAGDVSGARSLYAGLELKAEKAVPGMDSAMTLRDVARFDLADHQQRRALEVYRKTMVASGITPLLPQDDVTLTQLTRTRNEEDWLSRGIRSDVSDLFRQQNLTITSNYDYWGLSGASGYSRLRAGTSMIEADLPLMNGVAQFRADFVQLDAGRLKTDTPSWATCSTLYLDQACSKTDQHDMGVSVAGGWSNQKWLFDIGSTPIGMKIVTVAGGASYRGMLGPLGYTLNVHYRPLNNSLLSFGGQRDPRTGQIWGGVRATGLTWNLSYDKGGRNGVWASPSIDWLSGDNVQSNWRARWMAGYYYKIINEPNRRLTIGVNNMLWHYARNESGYTLGRGGYYSPDKYLSFSVPLYWRQRTARWSWELGGAVSWSTSSDKGGKRYPLQKLLNGWNLDDRYVQESGSSSSGLGYTVDALIERRISSHWSIGVGVDVQEARNYTPSHTFIFLRYYQDAWAGDMDLPPQPLTPYAEW